MVTFHPSVKKARDGFRPMVIIRNAKGQCVGSRVSKSQVYEAKDTARIAARIAAHRAASGIPEIARVS